MPGYIEKQLSKYNHPTPKRPQNAPYPCAPKTYGKSAQDPITTDNSPPAGQEGITHVQKSRRKHPILRTLVRQYPPRRTKHPCKRTGTHSRENNRKHETHVRLLSDESKRNSKILPIRHDIKRALLCVVSLRKIRQESSS